MMETDCAMTDRRGFLKVTAGAGLTIALPVSVRAQQADRATAFIKSTGERLIAVVNGAGSLADKRREIGKIVIVAVDVDAIGRFCLGRFWRQATPEQQKAYQSLFQEVIISSVTAKLGEYQGVRFTVGRTRSQDDGEIVSTVVERPNNAPATVEWVVAAAATPKIVDVIAEGTSLRITQRSDYAAYLQRNNNSIDSLIGAMRKQVETGA